MDSHLSRARLSIIRIFSSCEVLQDGHVERMQSDFCEMRTESKSCKDKVEGLGEP